MKKILLLIISLLLIFALLGCEDKSDAEIKEDPEININATDDDVTADVPADTDHSDIVTFKFPEGTVIAGVDVSGLLGTEAYDLISETVSQYSFKLVVNGTAFDFKAADIELTCSRKAVTDYFKALSNGEDVESPDVLSFNAELISSAVSRKFNHSATDATIRYSTSDGKFKIFNHSYGSVIDTKPVVEAAESAVKLLLPETEVSARITETEPTVKADSEQARIAVDTANRYLSVSLTYNFTPDDGETATETITRDRIASFIRIDSDFNVTISTTEIENYASKLAEKYNLPGDTGKFITTGGYELNINVTYSGQAVDISALSNDIYNCIKENVSGTRTAPYLDKAAAAGMPFGGNYVEVNMSAQYVWVYKNGVCVASAPIVTGNVYKGWNTPRGVYTVNNKVRNTYLRGANYVSFVYYWIAFIGNSYGLHDATWRNAFGGDIYLYNGSHGCINLPLSAAALIYDNISVGTKVIIYGGASNAEPVQQIIKGTDVYNVSVEDGSFVLDAKAEYTVSKLTYTSSDSNVVTVSGSGEVTIVGAGSATITVTAPEEEYYTSAEFKVTVNVTSPCSEGIHTFGEWIQVTAPTCAAGEETRKCEYCSVSEHRAIAPVSEHTPGETYIKQDSTCLVEGIEAVKCSNCGHDVSTTAIPVKSHSFAADNGFCLNGCGTANPDYVAPDVGDDNTENGDSTTDEGYSSETDNNTQN